MSEKRLSKNLTQIRAKIIQNTWDKWKFDITMFQLSEIFKIKVSEVYKILKENKTGSATWKATATIKK